MPLTDLPHEDLVAYRPDALEPADFDDFWSRTLTGARSHGGEPELTRMHGTHLVDLDVFDVRFPGWNGEPVAAWLLVPKDASGPLPMIVKFLGYTWGRGVPTDHLVPPAAGYAHLVVDSRGQGHDTPDRGEGAGTQWVGGFMTRGIEDPHHHYYRRLITDCVRAVDAARALPFVDPNRVVVAGRSQGGGLTLAVAALADGLVAAALPDVPFLCNFRRGAQICDRGPYVELADFLRVHSREKVEQTFSTLSYFDGVHFAARASAPALFSVGLMDPICPPSTVYSAYNRYAGPAELSVWEYADHGGGYGSSAPLQLAWLAGQGLSPKGRC